MNENLSLSLYTSRLKDAWNQHYFGLSATYPLSDVVALLGSFNYYKAIDEGRELLGEFNNNIGVPAWVSPSARTPSRRRISETTVTTTLTTCARRTRST